MLERYKKAGKGGFEQLLFLIETSTPQKQQQLIDLVAKEDPGWASLIYIKMLTVERIFSWDAEIIREATEYLSPRILAVALHGAPAGSLEKTASVLQTLKAREVEELFDEVQPTAEEVSAACIQLIQCVRKCEKAGKIRLMDPNMDGLLSA